MSNDNQLTQQDLDFIKGCMPGRGSYTIIGVVVLIGAPILLLAAMDMPTAGKILFGTLAVFGLIGGGWMIWMAIRNIEHPIMTALKSDPTQLSKIYLVGFDVATRRSGWTHVHVCLRGGGDYPILCRTDDKTKQFVQTLLKAAPHLHGQVTQELGSE